MFLARPRIWFFQMKRAVISARDGSDECGDNWGIEKSNGRVHRDTSRRALWVWCGLLRRTEEVSDGLVIMS